MKQLLLIDSCVSTHKPSRTRALCEAFLEQFQGHWEIEHIVLERAGLYPLTQSALARRDRQVAAQDFFSPEFDLARQVAGADGIVVAAPYWDLSFPSLLKLFIEHIMVSGITFHYTDQGPAGLCRAERLAYITTAGGFIAEPDWGYGYVAAIAAMLGIGRTDCLSAQGLDIDGADVAAIMAEAEAKARALTW
jgi:FMN-dependent NADH-azoreductase